MLFVVEIRGELNFFYDDNKLLLIGGQDKNGILLGCGGQKDDFGIWCVNDINVCVISKEQVVDGVGRYCCQLSQYLICLCVD